MPMVLIKILSELTKDFHCSYQVYMVFTPCPGRELLSGPELKVFVFKVLKGRRSSAFAMGAHPHFSLS